MNTLKSDKPSLDPFDKLIFIGNLRAKQLLLDKSLDIMVIVFNNGSLVRVRLSDYSRLWNASASVLDKWEFMQGGIGIRWEELDEDLSIKGFIKTAALSDALRNLEGN